MDFLSFVIRELLTFECVVSNRSPLWAINQKNLPGPNRVNFKAKVLILLNYSPISGLIKSF